MSKAIDLSVVIPVLARVDDLQELHAGYQAAVEALGLTFEMIYVVDGGGDEAFDTLQKVAGNSANTTVMRLAKHFGESMALSAGFDRSNGDMILTLPAYHQVEPDTLSKLFDAMPNCDMAIGRRWPRAGSSFEHFRRRTFHWLLRVLSGESYHDLGCGVRLLKRQVVKEIDLYGDQHRFFPVLANRQGFIVQEVDVTQSPKDDFKGRYRIREYLHRVLDIITVFFLVRFTKKPLRFFGMVGSIAAALGGLVVFVLVIQRLFFEMALADRPALLLGSLLLVLGVQIFALGLVGELIIFTHAGHMKEYTVAEIVSSDNSRDES